MNGDIAPLQGEEGQSFLVSFSSEEPYERWFGMEVLSHENGAVDLTRLNDMGVVLFNHQRNQVIGRVLRAWIENNRGKAEIAFDEDAFSQTIRQKVESGTLKGVSVSYDVGCWEEVKVGSVSSNGRHKGPCSVAAKWTPMEISIVSVPADATVGVGRSCERNQTETVFWENQITVNKNYIM